MFKNGTIKSKLTLTSPFVACTMIAMFVVSMVIMDKIKIKGQKYDEIILSKDLIADILPPPEYIIETKLVTHFMIEATKEELPALKEKQKRYKRTCIS